MKKGIQISVVVTIYNMEAYLERCLSSLARQRIENVEFLLLDDGSTDSSLNICKSYAIKDERFRIIHKSNSGVAATRNMGLENALGEYIWFVDSDDWIADGALILLAKNIEKYDPDILFLDFKKVYQYSVPTQNYSEKVCVMDAETLWGEFLKERLHDYNWSQVVRTKIYHENGIKFPEGRYFEDTATIYKCYLYADRIVKCEDVLYYYFHRDMSISNALNIKKIQDMYWAIHSKLDNIKGICSKNENLKESYILYALNCYVQIYVFTLSRSLNRKDTLEMQRELKAKITEFKLGIKYLFSFKEYSMFKHYILYKKGFLKIAYRLIEYARAVLSK